MSNGARKDGFTVQGSNPPLAVSSVQLRSAEHPDVDGMVSCHIEAFPRQFMTEMGPRWLRGLYGYFISHDDGICLVAIGEAGQVLGFAVGGEPTIRSEFLRRAVFRYSYILLWKFFCTCIVRKKLLAELLRKVRVAYRRDPKATTAKGQRTDTRRSGNLLSIGVLPQYRGTGVAGKLIEAFRTASVEGFYDVLKLSVQPDNGRAIAFYRKHGWREVGRDGRSIRLQLDLPHK